MPVQLVRAMAQHANYLKMVNKCLSGEPDTCLCVDHHSCKFGQWFDSDGHLQFGISEDADIQKMWAEIGKHHEQFHEYSLTASQLFHTGGNKSDIRDAETKMLQTSTWLMNGILALDKIAEEKSGVRITTSKRLTD